MRLFSEYQSCFWKGIEEFQFLLFLVPFCSFYSCNGYKYLNVRLMDGSIYQNTMKPLHALVDVRPLKKSASSLGGLMQRVMQREPDNMTFEDFRAKCSTWLGILEMMKEMKSEHVREK